ncbi:MAG: hypothetical protein JWM56_254 [Candidatus Peribacteria bacterium]|nr:hypothetical protein [Candidatus Peribacteria bacterium]
MRLAPDSFFCYTNRIYFFTYIPMSFYQLLPYAMFVDAVAIGYILQTVWSRSRTRPLNMEVPE